jgi:DNA repair exonuclease SbcCD ATPase subunit
MSEDSPEIDRYWAGVIDARIKGLSEQFDRERKERIEQFNEDRRDRKQYNEGVRNVMEAQTEAVRTLTSKVEQVLPEVRAHAEQIDELVPTITKSKERLDEWEPHVKHYASSRLEAAGRAKLAKGAAAVWGAIGAAVMFALTWLVGGHFPKS